MSADRTDPRVGDLVVVYAPPLCRVAELGGSNGVQGALVTDDQLQAWVPLAWLVRVNLRDPNGGQR